METKDHLYLAKLITGAANFGGKLKKSAFEYGCISPDVNPLTYVKGHTYASTASYVRNTLNRLHGRLKSPVDYFDLGRAVHFIGDYFTFPHTPRFQGSLSEHISYENCLHRHIITDSNEITTESRLDLSNAKKCIELLESVHEKYSKTRSSIANDWNYIRFMCSSISMSAAKCKVRVPKLVPAGILI